MTALSDFMTGISPPVAWLCIGLLLCIAEMLAPGIFLLWLGFAALATGLVTFLLPIPIAMQLALFAVLAVGSVFVGRRWTRTDAIPSTDPMLNDRIARLVGQTVVVEQAISGGQGRVRVGDGVWPARGPDSPVGARLTITGAESGVLLLSA